ncbi:MAG: eCIS core domain-containing protein [Myxococcota bacterium]
MNERVEDRDELRREEQRQRLLELDRREVEHARQLLDRVDELVLDFAEQPEQVGYHLAELEELGRVDGADKEALYWRIADRAGRDFADRAFRRDTDTSAVDLLEGIRADRERARPAGDVVDPDAVRAERTTALLRQLADAFGLAAGDLTVRVDDEARGRTDARGASGLQEDGHVWLHPDRYDPGTRDGRYLLGHEVAHAAQRGRPDAGSADVAGAEREAADLGEAFAAGHTPTAPERGLPASHAAADSDAEEKQEESPGGGDQATDGRGAEKKADSGGDGEKAAEAGRGSAGGDAGGEGKKKAKQEATSGGGEARKARGGEGRKARGGEERAGGDEDRAAREGEKKGAEGGAPVAGKGGKAEEGPAPKDGVKATLGPVAPADTEAQPEVRALPRLQVPAAEGVTEQQAKAWKERTGRTPAEHHARIQGALDALHEEAQRLQQLLVDGGGQAEQTVDAAAEGHEGSLRAWVQGERQTIGGLSLQARGRLRQQVQATRQGIAGDALQGRTLLLGEQEARTSLVRGSFVQFRQRVSQVRSGGIASLRSLIDEKVAEIEKLGRDSRGKVDEEAGSKSDALDPSSASGEESLDLQVKKDAWEDGAKELSDKIETTVLCRTDELREEAEGIADQATTGFVVPLEGELATAGVQAEERVRSAAAHGEGRLRADADRADRETSQVGEDTDRKLDEEGKRAEQRVDEAGENMVHNVRGAGEDLKTRLRRRIKQDLRFYEDQIAVLRDGLAEGGPHRYEDVEPRLQRLREELRARHAEHLGHVDSLREQGLGDLEGRIGRQQEGFAAATGAERERILQLEGGAQRDLGATAGRFGRKLVQAPSHYGQAITGYMGPLGAGGEQFVGRTDAGLQAYRDRIGTLFDKARVQLQLRFELMLARLEDTAKERAEKTLPKKKDQLGKDATSLRAAMDGWGTDEGAIHETLRSKSYGEVEALEAIYDDHYVNRATDERTPLRADLHDEMSGDDLGIALAYLDHRRSEAIELELEDSTGWLNDDEERIHDVLRSCSQEEIEHLNEDSESKAAVDQAVGALGGADKDIATTLLDPDLDRETAHIRADAIDLHEAMDGWGTDEEQVYSLLEGCKTAADRRALKEAYDAYSDEQGGYGDLDTAIAEEFSDSEKAIAEAVAGDEYGRVDQSEVAAARIWEASEGAGTDERTIIEQFEKVSKDIEDPEKRKEALDDLRAKYEEITGGESLDERLKGEMGDWTAEGAERDLEAQVAGQLAEKGSVDPGLKILYGCEGMGTDLETLREAVTSSSGEALPKSKVREVRADFAKYYEDYHGESAPSLESYVGGDLSGSDEFEVDLLLYGKPETPADFRHVVDRYYEFHRGGLSFGVLTGTLEALGYSSTLEQLEAQKARFDEEYEANRERAAEIEELEEQRGSEGLSEEDRARLDELKAKQELSDQELEELCGYVKADAEAYGAAKRAAWDTAVLVLEVVATVVVGVLLAAPSGGASIGFAGAVLSELVIGATGIAVKEAALGSAYHDDLGRDVIAALASASTAGIANLKAVDDLAQRGGKAVIEGLEKAGVRLGDEGLELGQRGIRRIIDVLEQNDAVIAKEAVKSAGVSTVSDLQAELLKVDQYTRLEDWLADGGLELLKNVPKNLLVSAVGAVVGNALKSDAYVPTFRDELIADLGSSVAEAITGHLADFDSYVDGDVFWEGLLMETLKGAPMSVVKATVRTKAIEWRNARALEELNTLDDMSLHDRLVAVDGIGDTLAQRIVELRNDRGTLLDLTEIEAADYVGPVKAKAVVEKLGTLTNPLDHLAEES